MSSSSLWEPARERLTEKKEDLVEFKWLEAKPVGSDTVTFRLEDGAIVKIKVDVDRAGVAVNFTNPDGNPALSHQHLAENNCYPAPKEVLR